MSHKSLDAEDRFKQVFEEYRTGKHVLNFWRDKVVPHYRCDVSEDIYVQVFPQLKSPPHPKKVFAMYLINHNATDNLSPFENKGMLHIKVATLKRAIFLAQMWYLWHVAGKHLTTKMLFALYSKKTSKLSKSVWIEC